MASKEDSDGGHIDDLLAQMQNMHITKDNITIPPWLEDCESPFHWHIQGEKGLGSEFVIARTMEKLEDLQFDEPGFSLQRYISLLKLVLQYYITGDVKKSWENMTTIEDLLEKEAALNGEDYLKAKLSLDHVILSTKATLLALDGKEEESKKIGLEIVPVKIMTEINKTPLYCVKAHFFLYSGYENGERIGVGLMKKALEFEPDNAEWKYLLAKMLRQQRRGVPFSMDIPKEELFLLESANEKRKDAKYLMYLAQVYRECATQGVRQFKNKPGFYQSELYQTVQKMNEKALCYYKEALDLQPDSPSILRRCGYGIMNLPKNITDYDLALKCLLKSEELSSNQSTLHILGTFFHRYRNDNEKALEYFEKTVKLCSPAGLSDMVRIKYMMDKDYDPCPELEEGLKWELKKNYLCSILVQLGGYYLFIKRDFNKSIYYFNQIIEENVDSAYIKTYKCIFLRMVQPINLFEYLANEALLLLNGNSSQDTNSCDKEVNLEEVEDFIDELRRIDPKYVEITPDPELIDNLLRMSEEYKTGHRGGNFNQRRNKYDRQGASHSDRGFSSRDNLERRGRFSVVNQRERSTQYNSKKRGARTFSTGNRTQGRNQDETQHSELPMNDEEQNRQERRGPKKYENWRRQ